MCVCVRVRATEDSKIKCVCVCVCVFQVNGQGGDTSAPASSYLRCSLASLLSTYVRACSVQRVCSAVVAVAVAVVLTFSFFDEEPVCQLHRRICVCWLVYIHTHTYVCMDVRHKRA